MQHVMCDIIKEQILLDIYGANNGAVHAEC